MLFDAHTMLASWATRVLRWSLGSTLAMLVFAAEVEAQVAAEAPRPRYGRKAALIPKARLDGHVVTTWDGAFGVGVRADWLLIEGTFRYSTRDELAISFGGDVTFISFDGDQAVQVFPTVMLQWSISVDDRLFFYPELGLVAHVDDGNWEGLYPNIGFGSRYYLHRTFGLQARLGWPMALSLGVVF